MTLIIGARCRDGVIIISDKKIIEGNIPSVDKKIRKLSEEIVITGAGTTEVIDKFNDKLSEKLEEKKKEQYNQLLKSKGSKAEKVEPEYLSPYTSLNMFFDDCEDILKNLHNRYKTHSQVIVGLGFREKAELYCLEPTDEDGTYLTSRRRTHISIGSGSPYAKLLLKKLWKPDLSMDQMTKIGEFIIHFVEKSNIDVYVGGGVQVFYIPDLPEEFAKLDENTQKYYFPKEIALESNAKSLVDKFDESLMGLFK